MSMPGPPHIEPPRCAGQSSQSSGKREQPLVHRAEDLASPLGLLDGEIGASHVTDEQAVPAQHRPRLVAAGGVDQQEGGVLGAVPGGVQGAHRERSQAQLPAVLEGLVLVRGIGQAMDVDACPGSRHQAPVPGDVVGVVVGLEHVLDRDPPVAGQLEVLVDLKARVDDRGDPGPLVADQIRGATEVVVGDLLEEHRPQPALLSAAGARCECRAWASSSHRGRSLWPPHQRPTPR